MSDDDIPGWAMAKALGAVACSCGHNMHHRKCEVVHVATAIAEAVDIVEDRIRIHVADLQQLADHFKYVLPESTWARMQAAINGLKP